MWSLGTVSTSKTIFCSASLSRSICSSAYHHVCSSSLFFIILPRYQLSSSTLSSSRPFEWMLPTFPWCPEYLWIIFEVQQRKGMRHSKLNDKRMMPNLFWIQPKAQNAKGLVQVPTAQTVVFCVHWLLDCVLLLDKYCSKLGNHFLPEQCEVWRLALTSSDIRFLFVRSFRGFVCEWKRGCMSRCFMTLMLGFGENIRAICSGAGDPK